MIRTQSAASVRARFAADESKQPSYKEQELRRMYDRLRALVAFLQANPQAELVSLPLPPNMLNSSFANSLGWRARSEIKAAYIEECDTLRSMKLIPAPPKEPEHKTRLSIVMVVRKAMDNDNLRARMKIPQDWLKHRGYIRDDNDTALEIVSLNQDVQTRGIQRVEVRYE